MDYFYWVSVEILVGYELKKKGTKRNVIYFIRKVVSIMQRGKYLISTTTLYISVGKGIL